jgi:hypothetical protein
MSRSSGLGTGLLQAIHNVCNPSPRVPTLNPIKYLTSLPLSTKRVVASFFPDTYWLVSSSGWVPLGCGPTLVHEWLFPDHIAHKCPFPPFQLTLPLSTVPLTLYSPTLTAAAIVGALVGVSGFVVLVRYCI